MAIKDKDIISLDISNVIQAVHVQYIKRSSIKCVTKKADYKWNYNIIKIMHINLIGFACLNRNALN